MCETVFESVLFGPAVMVSQRAAAAALDLVAAERRAQCERRGVSGVILSCAATLWPHLCPSLIPVALCGHCAALAAL